MSEINKGIWHCGKHAAGNILLAIISGSIFVGSLLTCGDYFCRIDLLKQFRNTYHTI